MKGLTDVAATVVGISGVLFEQPQGEGVVVIFGHWHLGPGQEKRHFMEQDTTKNDLMIVICISIREERFAATTDESRANTA